MGSESERVAGRRPKRSEGQSHPLSADEVVRSAARLRDVENGLARLFTGHDSTSSSACAVSSKVPMSQASAPVMDAAEPNTRWSSPDWPGPPTRRATDGANEGGEGTDGDTPGSENTAG